MNTSRMHKTILSLVAILVSSTAAKAQGGTGGGSSEEFLYGILISFGLLFLVIILVLNSVMRNMANNHELWTPKKPTENVVKAVTFLLMMGTGSAYAISPDATLIGVFGEYSSTFWLLVCFDLFLGLIIVIQLRSFRQLIESLKKQEAETDVSITEEEVVVVGAQQSNWMKKVMKMLTKAVPIEREEEVMTAHEYDGIRELDNVLPPWWIAMFYASIIFAFAYLLHYHVFETGDLQIAELNKTLAEADAEVAAYMAANKAQVDETNVTIVTDASRLSNGEDIYVTNCVACHGTLGEGGVGPNFADEYWIHGGSINDVFSVIKYGVPSKGMISWRAQLSPTQIQDVASYLLTFQGTNPPNQKAAEGELYKPSGEDGGTEEVDDDGEKSPDDATTEAEGDDVALNN